MFSRSTETIRLGRTRSFLQIPVVPQPSPPKTFVPREVPTVSQGIWGFSAAVLNPTEKPSVLYPGSSLSPELQPSAGPQALMSKKVQNRLILLAFLFH